MPPAPAEAPAAGTREVALDDAPTVVSEVRPRDWPAPGSRPRSQQPPLPPPVPAARGRFPAPAWLLAMWKEIDDKTFGEGFDCFSEDAVCNLGVADWHGREEIRNNLREFIDKGFTAHHDVVEYWDSPLLKVFHGKVGMKFDDPSIKPVRPTMTHFFYMDEKDSTKVKLWIGSVGPTGF